MQEDDIQKSIDDILQQWDKCRPKQAVEVKEVEDVDAKLAKLMENKHIKTTVQRQYTPDELRIREHILSQYATVEIEDGYDDEEEGGAGPSTSGQPQDPLLVKNTNAQDVAQLAKDRREQARLDSKAKKDKDKEDREKQKQLREEKKEKRKTVKGERRR